MSAANQDPSLSRSLRQVVWNGNPAWRVQRATAVPPVLARWVVRSHPSHPIYILPTLLFFCLLQIIYSDGMLSARRPGPPGTLREVGEGGGIVEEQVIVRS